MFPIVFFFFPVAVLASLLDVAIFFMIVRVLTRMWPSDLLRAVDRVGKAGVDMIVDGMSAALRRWRPRPLSVSKQEFVALLVLWAARTLLAALVRV